ncbi:aminotransferase class I/II-fold pyridoxal phosphate-dependent enzyme, partial [Salmonella enterica subsp. enterica serovar Montevideo]|nr:aminotransferase class I/II-fold pyridoxal phosphate-dependent enzyme [Salmonella enterica subsp. enterica serovar Montevideo]
TLLPKEAPRALWLVTGDVASADGQHGFAWVRAEHLMPLSPDSPTNPTGNVITDEELMKLDRLANQHNIPLVIDNAYGVPFPGI